MASYASDNGTVPRYGHHITDTVNPVISYSSVIRPIYHTPAHNRFPNKRAPSRIAKDSTFTSVYRSGTIPKPIHHWTAENP